MKNNYNTIYIFYCLFTQSMAFPKRFFVTLSLDQKHYLKFVQLLIYDQWQYEVQIESVFVKFFEPYQLQYLFHLILFHKKSVNTKHLRKKIIKTPLEPEITFSDDPLRMMRAIRFATQLEFDIEPDTYDALSVNKERIKIVSKERISDELNKIILSKKPSYGFNLLFQKFEIFS